ncbi:MAG: hypothetical protein ACK5U8_03600 [Deltaproteobacteria bacterium]|jgi:hypothetical protein
MGSGWTSSRAPAATACCVSGSRLIAANDVATLFDEKGLVRLLRAKGLPDQLEPIRRARGPPPRDFDFGL